jgi:hypothetical protein
MELFACPLNVPLLRRGSRAGGRGRDSTFIMLRRLLEHAYIGLGPDTELARECHAAGFSADSCAVAERYLIASADHSLSTKNFLNPAAWRNVAVSPFAIETRLPGPKWRSTPSEVVIHTSPSSTSIESLVS